MYKDFINERVLIGSGMQADVYEWKGFAYKCFHDDYPKEWIAYEKMVQDEVSKSNLPVPHCYETVFPNTIKMDFINGISLLKKYENKSQNAGMSEFMELFQKIHKVKGLDIPHFTESLQDQINRSQVDDSIKVLANTYLNEVEQDDKEHDTLCHLDFHPLNIIDGENGICIIDWMNAKIAKPIWDYARTYVLFYESVPNMLAEYVRQIYAKEKYEEKLFYKAVFVSAVCRLNENDTERMRKLIEGIKNKNNK